MQKIRLLVFVCCFSLIAFSQETMRNTASIGAGGGFPSGGWRTDGFSNSPSFSASYEFRIFKYLAAEGAVVNMLPNVNEGGEFVDLIARERVTLLSFGARGILPLRQGRIELFAGAGAAHLFTSDFYLSSFDAPSWIYQVNTGGRVALDHRHHFWVGPTVRFYRDGGRPTEEWVSLTGDFGVRF